MGEKNIKEEEHLKTDSEDKFQNSDDQEHGYSINYAFVNNIFKSRLKLLFCIGFTLAFVSIVFLFLSLLIPQINSEKHDVTFQEYSMAKNEFEEHTNITNEWLSDIQMPDSIIYVNLRDSSIIFNDISSLEPVKFYFNEKYMNIIHVEDTSALETILQLFNIEKSNSVSEIAKKINANSEYVQEIDKAKEIDKINISTHDIVCSLIYNTVVGDSQGHIAVTIQKNKLNVVRELRFDMVNKMLFVRSVNNLLAQDNLSVKKKFAISGCKPEINSPLSRISQVDSIQKLINIYFNTDSVVVLNKPLKKEFIYYNQNSDKLMFRTSAKFL